MKKIINFFKQYFITILIYVGFVLLYIYMSTDKDRHGFLFPSIDRVINSYSKDANTMWLNVVYTFQLLIPSILISTSIALVLGTWLGLNKKVRKVLHPVVYSTSVIPSLLMSPFALLLAPTFRAASMFLVVYGTIWPTLFSTINGIMTIDSRYLDNANVLEIKGFKRFFKIIFPAAMPSILSGFTTSLRNSFVVLVYAEMYGTNYGLGYYVTKNAEYGQYQNSWAGFVLMAVILVVIMLLFDTLKNHILRWTMN